MIGTRCWLKENLNAGLMIDSSQSMQDNGYFEKYCYHNNVDSCAKYGGLYQWDEIMQYTTQQGVQGICPPGWHVPTDAEWTSLTIYVSNIPAFLCNNEITYIAKALAATTDWHPSYYFSCAPATI